MNNKRLPKLASVATCSGCMACADSCPTDVLTMSVDADGHYYPVIAKDKCIGCLKCERTCPVVNGYKYGDDPGESKPWMVWDENIDSRMKSTSGGFFGALARYVIGRGGIVYGAVSEGQEVRHIRITELEDLHRLQGSKYLQSNLAGIYVSVKNDLTEGRLVLFSGTGCQVAGLLSFVKTSPDNLFTVDLICAGVPSKLALHKFCEEEKIDPEVISWRNKDRGWRHGLQLTINDKDGIELRYNTDNCFFGGAFLGGSTNRISCYDCKFCGAGRKSTFTIGDFWGVKHLSEKEMWNGVSMVISHGSNSEEILRKCEIHVAQVPWKEAISHNPRTVMGKRPLSWMNVERKLLPYAFSHYSYSTLKIIYAGAKSKSVLYFLWKLLKYPRYRMVKFLTERKVNKIISRL